MGARAVQGAVRIAILVLAAVAAASLPNSGDGALLQVVPAVVAWSVGYGVRFLWTVPAGLAGIAGAVLAGGFAVPAAGLSTVLTLLTVVGLPWWAGRALAIRRDHAARVRRLELRAARWDERRQIAQDMHDSLGHDLSVIALQAGAWELKADGAEQRAAAAAVRGGAVAATDRLQSVIGLLAGTTAEPDLIDVVDRARERGVPVELVRSGRDGPSWSEPTRYTAYRIVQECLTNAVRHAPGEPVTVRVHDGDPVRLEITNPRPDRETGSSGGGRGIAGVRARAERIGGTVDVRPGPDVFGVEAILPRKGTPRGTPAGGVPGVDVAAERRSGRRRHLRAAVVPLTLVGVVAAGLVTAHVVTVQRTALSPQRYDSLELDRPRSALAARLPARSQAEAPPVLVVPPAPAGTRCELYPARGSVLDLTPDMFRLCFTAGVADPILVVKDRLRPAGAP
ncbi:MAG: histidine kinase [Pseudonocardia sp.]|nr:histidine kinase [Pseudonocardia sp.]